MPNPALIPRFRAQNRRITNTKSTEQILRDFGVEIALLDRILGHFDRVFAIFSSGCRGPTTLSLYVRRRSIA